MAACGGAKIQFIHRSGMEFAEFSQSENRFFLCANSASSASSASSVNSVPLR